MKKLLLLSFAVAATLSSFAQETVVSGNPFDGGSTAAGTKVKMQTPSNKKTTALADTVLYADAYVTDTPGISLWYDYVSPLDSGFFYGTNWAGFKAWGQLYELQVDGVTPVDTTVTIIGFYAKFGGRVQTSSTKSVNFSIWKRGTDKSVIYSNRPKFFMYGTPQATAAATKTVQATALSLTNATVTYLATPLSGINEDVYVGYSMTYNWSSLALDTFGLKQTKAGYPNYYNVSSGDTLLSINNLYQENGGAWKSGRYHLGITSITDLQIAPIVRLSCPTCWPSDVAILSRNNLTMYSSYPNPANNSMNVKFGLKNNADVTINIVDINGRTLNTIKKTCTAGENIINVETASLPNGNYVYAIETSEGDIMASQFSVAK